MGNNTYYFGEDKLIWDGGGTDHITAAKSKKAVTININDGKWNYEGSKASSFLDDTKGDQVFLGYYTKIENLTGSKYSDRLTGNEFANKINGGTGNDRIYGGSGNDTLTGGTGNDVIYGQAGNDRLIGGTGKDVLVSGSGRDTFHFNAKPSSTNIDTIDDFSVAFDTIWLDDDAFVGIGKVGDLAASAFRIASKALDSSDRIIYDSVRGKIWFDADGSGSGKAMEFARIDKGLKMTAADFDILA